MKKYFFLCFLFIISLHSIAQSNIYKSEGINSHQFLPGTIPTVYDSIYQLNLPELNLPENLKNAALPPIVDNSKNPFLRPVFTQVGASCGQASAIGYNFTYEMNHARNLAADTSINQYPTHFAYNFENTGWEYFGVSYFHSFEVLKKCGTMNVQDYGGLTDNGNRWISGYDAYYHGMSNRIEEVYTIKTNSPKGILTLKNWVFNHLGESAFGGVASFYSGYSVENLPYGTPEQGRPVATNFTAPATHAMCIVGYNDSIRFDYNHDGKYTNDLDINLDGIVDVSDWEIGGFRVVNSYGNDWPSVSDSGFFYMMYHTLGAKYGSGGIWNNAVNVVKVKENYSPLLTMKIRLNHNQRNLLRVRAGVSTDPTSLLPEKILDFPIFDFQGGSFPMQGSGISDTVKSIEFGLDITSLLSYIQNNKDVAFYLIVDENDPYSQSTGTIEHFSVIDYSTSPPKEYINQEVPIEISNNDQTIARVILSTNQNKVKINETSLPAFVAGQPYAAQLTASGGQPPYKWSLNFGYTKLLDNQSMLEFEGNKIIPAQPTDNLVAVPLGFSFRFYEKNYDTVYINPTNGYMQFTQDKIPWPYLNEENLLLQSYCIISPLTNLNLNAYTATEGAWYSSDSVSAKFRWKLSKKLGETYFPYEFQARLCADGTIVFNRSNISVSTNELFLSGISNGNKQDYDLSVFHNGYDANQYNQVKFVPVNYPENLKINNTGLVECVPTFSDPIYTIDAKVEDDKNITDNAQLQLTSGIVAKLQVHTGTVPLVYGGEDATVDLIVTNLTGNPFTNLKVSINIDDRFVNLGDTVETIGLLNPNSSTTIQDAFKFNTLQSSPDGHTFRINYSISNTNQEWKGTVAANILSPLLKSIELKSTKPGNELPKPGEVSMMQYKFSNAGHAKVNNVSISANIPDTRVKLLSPAIQSVGTVIPGQKASIEYQILTSDSIALGTIIPIVVNLISNIRTLLTDTLFFRVGKAPALVIDLDPNHLSAPTILEKITGLGYIAAITSAITSEINEYQSLFITLGKSSNRHILSYTEGDILTNFLNQGGNIYLESRYVWRDDLLTSLQPRFNIQTSNKLHVYDTLAATTGAFTDGMKFTPNTPLVSMSYMQAVWGAFGLFEDNTFTCSVANDAGTYKTIGCYFEFSALQGVNPESTLPKLMQEYLDFFDIKRNAIGIGEQISKKNTGGLTVYPNPTSERVYLSFSKINKLPIEIAIFDVNGKLVAELSDNNPTNNNLHNVEWNLRNKSGQKVPPGIYICKVVDDKEVKIAKIIVK